MKIEVETINAANFTDKCEELMVENLTPNKITEPADIPSPLQRYVKKDASMTLRISDQQRATISAKSVYDTKDKTERTA